MRVASLFAGCGGFDLGFREAGYELVWANEIDSQACQTYRKNIGDHVVCEDIRKIKSADIPDFDVLLGGFPCQGFSIANGSRSTLDERNFLYLEMLRIIEEKKPTYFVAENVKGIFSLAGGKVFEQIIKDFESIGYTVDWELVTASDYGVPQHRQRVIIIGKRGEDYAGFPTPLRTPQISVKEAIGHLKDLPIQDDPIPYQGGFVHNHIAYTNVSETYFARKHLVEKEDLVPFLQEHLEKSDITIKDICKEFNSKRPMSWFRKDIGSLPSPEEWLILKKMLDCPETYDTVMVEVVEKEKVFEQMKRITNWETPSDTIVASGAEIHVNKERRLSVRECAILQSFPDDFVFCGSLAAMHRQVGNAVPPKLATAIAEALKHPPVENDYLADLFPQ